MARMYNDFKKMSTQRKFCTYGLLIFIVIVLMISIKFTYAYYNDSDSYSMIGATIGDFDPAKGDINMKIYKQPADSNEYVLTYGVPSVGYTFKNEKTFCYNTITKEQITCNNDNTGDCHYTYNQETADLSLTSNQKVTCEFYFERTTESDVNLYMYVEDDDHIDRIYNNKNYKLVNDYPTGYKFTAGVCDNSNGNSSTVTCDDNNKKCTVTSNEKSKCRAYFDKQNTE